MGKRLDDLAHALRNRPGLFVSFEGGDGCGKSTQIGLLNEALSDRGVNTLATREPGGTPLGAQLRAHIQHGPEDIDPRTEALLYAADRAYHAATVLRPALAAGTTVLADRYTDSSVAYQGAARQLGTDEVRGLSDWATQDLQPDLTFLLDIDPTEGLRRATLGGNPDRLERAGQEFHERVRVEYLRAAADHPERFIVIDASRPVREVFIEIVTALNSYLDAADEL